MGNIARFNMGSYHVYASTESRERVLPSGKYEMQRLTMGPGNSLHIFQEKMLDLMEEFEFTQAYIDDKLLI